jgi:hypothetical protein
VYSRLLGRALRFGLVKNSTVGFCHAETCGECRRHRPHRDAHPSAWAETLRVLDRGLVRLRSPRQDKTANHDSRTDRNANCHLSEVNDVARVAS